MSFIAPPHRSHLKWIAVDFDDTLARSNWSPDNPHALPGLPIWDNIDELLRCVGLGWKIVIHTARGSADYEIIESWLNSYRVPFHHIVTGKLLARAYIDDKAKNANSRDWLAEPAKGHCDTCTCEGVH